MRLDPWFSFPRELGVGGDSLCGNSPVESISPSLNLDLNLDRRLDSIEC